MKTITLRGVSTLGNWQEGPAKRLTDAEFQAEREKGLYFRCDERYSAGHRCKNQEQRELRILVVMEDDELEVFDDKDTKGEQVELQMMKAKGEIQIGAKLLINSVVGLTYSGMMKVKGRIQEEEVTMLIDCATHNYIAERLVSTLQSPIVETPNYGVILGSGSAIIGKGIRNVVKLTIGELILRDSFLPLEFEGVDVILGMQRLHTLGVTKVDLWNLTMTINQGGKTIVLKGDLSLTKLRGSLKSMIKSWTSWIKDS